MKIITILLLVSSLTLNDKLFGIWKSTDNNSVQYLNFKSDGKLLEVKNKETYRYDFTTKENFIQLELKNGGSIEQLFYIDGDTLVIQSFVDGEPILNKYVKEKLAL
tara:strand:- start:703 stop:1020 length:318 start_codon:yes stop_codon:yes gene_type:complete